ncbi:MAG: hypothetical protein ACRYFU_05090 [Janthinobacterium lividum]
MRRRDSAAIAVTFAMVSAVACAQTLPSAPRGYRGIQVHVEGVFITPVPNAPFTATVEIVSHQKLADGTEHIVMTRNYIARSSSGRIRNERRKLVATGYKGEPRLLLVHLYDPSSRLSIFLDPATRLARETLLSKPLAAPAEQRAPAAPEKSAGTETDLGTQMLDSVSLQGTRKTRVIPAELSGTGQAVQITDEYWYSPDLSMYMIIKHNDPRTGEQIVAVSAVQRREPTAEEMAVPADYKVVDETPPPRPAALEDPGTPHAQP